MTAIASTAVRDTKQLGFAPVPLEYAGSIAPVKTGVNCRQGGIAALSPSGANSGYYQPAVTAVLGQRCMGIFQQNFDNTLGSNASADASGVTGAKVKSGVWFMACGTSTDAITQANVGQVCYVIDDQTVGLTDGGGTRSPAGIIVGFDSTLGLPAIAIGPQFLPATGLIYGNPKVQLVTGITLVSGTKAVAAASYSLTSSSVIVPILTAVNSSTALGAQYVTSSITTGIAGVAAFTVTAKAAADASTVTGDLSTLAVLIIN